MEGNDFAMWLVLFNVRAKESPLGTQVNPQKSSVTLKTISSALFFNNEITNKRASDMGS